MKIDREFFDRLIDVYVEIFTSFNLKLNTDVRRLTRRDILKHFFLTKKHKKSFLLYFSSMVFKLLQINMVNATTLIVFLIMIVMRQYLNQFVNTITILFFSSIKDV